MGKVFVYLVKHPPEAKERVMMFNASTLSDSKRKLRAHFPGPFMSKGCGYITHNDVVDLVAAEPRLDTIQVISALKYIAQEYENTLGAADIRALGRIRSKISKDFFT